MFSHTRRFEAFTELNFERAGARVACGSVRLAAFDVSKVMITDGHAAYDELLEEKAGKKSPRKCASC